jgi:hypothetical protein
MKKFNKFEEILNEYAKTLKGVSKLLEEENAISDQKTTGGLKVGSAFRLKPSFFTQSQAVKEMDSVQIDALKDINTRQYDRCVHYFKIQKAYGDSADVNVKSANNLNRLNVELTAISAAEPNNSIYKFVFPKSDVKFIDLESTAKEAAECGGLLPILGIPNKYDKVDQNAGIPQPVNDNDFVGLGNSPTGGRSYPTGGRSYPTGGRSYPTGGRSYPTGPTKL